MAREKIREKRLCDACQGEYYVPLWRLKRGNSRFCSVDCQNHKQYESKRHKFTCKSCNKEYLDSPSRIGRKYCSRECLEIKTKERREYRRDSMRKRRLTFNNVSSKSLRKLVWEFKEKKCEVCGYNEYDFLLEIHHIDQDPKNNIKENLAVLCCMCHKKLHRNVIINPLLLIPKAKIRSNK